MGKDVHDALCHAGSVVHLAGGALDEAGRGIDGVLGEGGIGVGDGVADFFFPILRTKKNYRTFVTLLKKRCPAKAGGAVSRPGGGIGRHAGLRSELFFENADNAP